MKAKAGRTGWYLLACLFVLLSGCSIQSGQTPAFGLPVFSSHEPGEIVRVEVIIIGMLFMAALVGLVTQRFGIPYTIGLVVVGFALTFLPQIPPLNISPEADPGPACATVGV